MYVDEAGIDHREEYPYGYCKVAQRFHALKSSKRKEKWLSLWGDKVTQQNLSDALAKTRWSRKKKTYGYRERDELKRQVFQQQLKTKRPRQMV